MDVWRRSLLFAIVAITSSAMALLFSSIQGWDGSFGIMVLLSGLLGLSLFFVSEIFECYKESSWDAKIAIVFTISSICHLLMLIPNNLFALIMFETVAYVFWSIAAWGVSGFLPVRNPPETQSNSRVQKVGGAFGKLGLSVLGMLLLAIVLLFVLVSSVSFR